MRIKVQELTKFVQGTAVSMNKLFALSVQDSNSWERALVWLCLGHVPNLWAKGTHRHREGQFPKVRLRWHPRTKEHMFTALLSGFYLLARWP